MDNIHGHLRESNPRRRAFFLLLPSPGDGRRFRWSIVWVLLAILVAGWFMKGVRVAFEWRDVMHWLGIKDEERFTRFCVLALCAICIIVVLRLFRSTPED